MIQNALDVHKPWYSCHVYNDKHNTCERIITQHLRNNALWLVRLKQLRWRSVTQPWPRADIPPGYVTVPNMCGEWYDSTFKIQRCDWIMCGHPLRNPDTDMTETWHRLWHKRRGSTVAVHVAATNCQFGKSCSENHECCVYCCRNQETIGATTRVAGNLQPASPTGDCTFPKYRTSIQIKRQKDIDGYAEADQEA